MEGINSQKVVETTYWCFLVKVAVADSTIPFKFAIVDFFLVIEKLSFSRGKHRQSWRYIFTKNMVQYQDTGKPENESLDYPTTPVISTLLDD